MAYGVAVASRGFTRPSRRTVLLLGATAPLAACALFDTENSVDPAPAPPHPDDLIRDDAVAAEQQLLASYAAVTAAHPELAADLAPFVERHERHVAALLATAPPAEPDATAATAQPATPAATPAMTESPAPEPTEAVTPPPVAGDPADAVRGLRDAETAAVQERLASCLGVHDGGLARILAGIAACEATHGRLLRRVRV